MKGGKRIDVHRMDFIKNLLLLKIFFFKLSIIKSL